MALQITANGRTLLYNADLLPSAGHIGMPYVMAYDIRPLVSMKEKEIMLEEAVANNAVLFFEHDPLLECATIKRDERGRIVIDKPLKLAEAFG